MAEICKDIDAALAALNRKIDEQNNHIRQLERRQKECCDNNKNKNNNQKPRDESLQGIVQRLSRIENYINILDKDIKLITNKIIETGNYLQELLEGIDTFFSTVVSGFTSVVKFFGVFK